MFFSPFSSKKLLNWENKKQKWVRAAVSCLKAIITNRFCGKKKKDLSMFFLSMFMDAIIMVGKYKTVFIVLHCSFFIYVYRCNNYGSKNTKQHSLSYCLEFVQYIRYDNKTAFTMSLCLVFMQYLRDVNKTQLALQRNGKSSVGWKYS